MIIKMGIISGEILAVLETAREPVKTQDITAYLKEPSEEVLMSIGWLIREGYVQVESRQGMSWISLNADKSFQAVHGKLLAFEHDAKQPAPRTEPSVKRKPAEGSERMYRDFIETIPCGVYMADVKGNLFYVNQAFVEILGYKEKKELIGLNLTNEL